ncbi:MAG: CTP synthetase [Roseicyclus sp.]|nr:CTP synthetase [Roseicyclus sp.]MBO6624761.1 CTP synthetase [Roseicyclus sp.]MBO6921481.1 CTP synthetase [Roseicyclus sp.]
MMRLFLLMFTLAATVLAGVGVTAVLAAGMDGWQPIVVAAVAGGLVALPAAWMAAKKIRTL